MNYLPNASDHLPAGAAADIIHWVHIFDGAGQVYCVVRYERTDFLKTAPAMDIRTLRKVSMLSNHGILV